MSARPRPLQKTIFATPWINEPMVRFARWLLPRLGWQLEGAPPVSGRYVLIVAPHTSN